MVNVLGLSTGCVTLGSACPLWALVFLLTKQTKPKKSLKGNLTQWVLSWVCWVLEAAVYPSRTFLL